MANAAAQTPVPLGTAASYAVLGGSTVTNSGTSAVTGDLGVSPGTAVTGFPPGTVTGTIRTAAAAAPAQADLTTAYNDAAGRQPVATVATELGGQTLVPGVYNSAAGTFGITGILTLDGQDNPNAVFIFKMASTLITAAGAPGTPASRVLLIRGAQACNIFWQVGSSATLGTYSIFQGSILAQTDITAMTGASVNGRVLARDGAVTLDTNTVTTPVCSASLQIVKNTIGGDGTFPFSSNFGLTSLTTLGGTASQTFNNVIPGSSYSLMETIPVGWTQSSATCTNGTPAAITVMAGETTTCTITNTLIPLASLGSIQIVKNTVGGNGTFAFTSNFGLTSLTTAGGTASQTFNSLIPGSSHSFSETVPAGWTQSSATCTNGTPAAITVVSGETTTCTITNTLISVTPLGSGSIQVIKNTVGGDGRFNFTSNFGLSSLTTAGGSSSQTVSNLAPGSSYSLSETVPAGWTQTSATCTDGIPTAIVVMAGETTTCTITNTRAASLAGSIQVIKNTVGGNGRFTFTSNFGLTSLTTAGGTASQTFQNVTPGSSYRLSETVPAGWTQSSATCTNGIPSAIVVVSGETTTCTVINTLTPGAVPVADLIIGKSHAGDFHQGDIGAKYTLTVTNAGQAPTTGVVNVSDLLPAGLTATAISGPGWSCTLIPLTCTRSDALPAAGSYPGITVTVNVASDGGAANSATLSPAFQQDDVLVSMADGTVQWRRRDLTPVRVLTSGTDGQAKGMAFDRAGNLYVTHWFGSGSSGNNIARFDRNGNFTGPFGTGFDCNPSSIAFDNNGNAYVGHADCSGQILKFDSLGNRLAQYDVAVENRGSYHVVLDPDQCTMYYTSHGPNVKRFNVCTNTQMPNFNIAPLPNAVEGAQGFSLVPGGGMLVANFSQIARLDASGRLVATYRTTSGNQCWLGSQLDIGGTSFLASNWCTSSLTRFGLETGNVIANYVVDDHGFMVKQIAIPVNIFSTVVTNIATVAGGGEVNIANNSASDPTTISPPALP